MDCAPVEKIVTCTYCKPPRTASPLAATMDSPPAVRLRFPPSTYPEARGERSGWSGRIENSRLTERIQNRGASRDAVGREGS